MSTDEGPVGLDCGSAKLPDIILLLPCPFVTVMQQCHQMRCGSNVLLGTSRGLRQSYSVSNTAGADAATGIEGFHFHIYRRNASKDG